MGVRTGRETEAHDELASGKPPQIADLQAAEGSASGLGTVRAPRLFVSRRSNLARRFSIEQIASDGSGRRPVTRGTFSAVSSTTGTGRMVDSRENKYLLLVATAYRSPL